MQICVEDNANESDLQIVRQGLAAFNAARVGDDQHQMLNLLVRDDQGQVIAGLLGDTYWGWLYIAILWLPENLRGSGLGSRLVTQAEQIAVQRGCHSAHLDTMSFQALGFYLKLGYTVWGQLDDLPRGHSRIFLKKSLARHLEASS